MLHPLQRLTTFFVLCPSGRPDEPRWSVSIIGRPADTARWRGAIPKHAPGGRLWRSFGCGVAALTAGLGATTHAAAAGQVDGRIPSRWIEITLGADLRDQREQTPVVSVEPTAAVAALARPRELALAAFGLGSSADAAGVTSFATSLDYLRTATAGRPLVERRAVLSWIGSQLQQGYSRTIANNPDMESMFQNTHTGGQEGGVCGDIHTYLSRVAPSTGFEGAGTHTAYWWIDARSGGGHAIAHFRDPISRQYYMQNYGQLYATGQTTLQNLVEVSSRILGVAWVSSVESLPGTMHGYMPRPARWISTQISESATRSLREPVLTARLTNRDQVGAVQYGWAGGHHQLKAYAVGARFAADEGSYDFGHVGAAYTYAAATSLTRGWLDHAGVNGTAYAGLLNLGLPILRPASQSQVLQPVHWRRSTSVVGVTAAGYVQRRGTTARVGFDWDETGLPAGSRKELHAGIEHRFDASPVSLAVERVWQLVDADGQPKNRQQLVAVYDRFGVQAETPLTATLVLGGQADYFALEGVEAHAGSAVRLGCLLTWRAGVAGEFTLAEQWGRVLENRTHDPFYELPSSHYATLGWQRPVGRRVVLGAEASYGRGPTVQPFGTFGEHTPELNDGARLIAIRGSVRLSF